MLWVRAGAALQGGVTAFTSQARTLEATAAAVGLKPLSWGGKTGDCGPGRRSFLWARPFCMRHITESCQTSRKVQIRMVKRKGGNKLFISKTLAFGDPRRSSIKW